MDQCEIFFQRTRLINSKPYILEWDSKHNPFGAPMGSIVGGGRGTFIANLALLKSGRRIPHSPSKDETHHSLITYAYDDSPCAHIVPSLHPTKCYKITEKFVEIHSPISLCQVFQNQRLWETPDLVGARFSLVLSFSSKKKVPRRESF